MAIETRIQPRQTIQNIAYAILCFGFGIYGWYDYSIAYPAQDARYAQWEAYKATKDEIVAIDVEKRSPEQRAKLAEAMQFIDQTKEAPTKREDWDYFVQIWIFVVGTGVIGTPWFVWTQWQLSRRKFRLDDDGGFHASEGSFAAASITGIDMSRWMTKSIAVVEVEGGRRITLDDYKYKGVEDIVAHFAQRFEPGKWTSDARPIGDPKSRDTKAQRDAEAAAAIAAEQREQGSDNAPNA